MKDLNSNCATSLRTRHDGKKILHMSARMNVKPSSYDPGSDPEECGKELLYQARRLIVVTQNPSVSFLQRHLRLGFKLSTALMVKLQGDIVTAPDDEGWRRMLGTGVLSPDDPRSEQFDP